MTPHASPPGPPVTQLRVYEPLTAFPSSARRYWTRYAENVPSRSRIVDLERRECWRRVVLGPEAGALDVDGRNARVLVRDDEVFLCPLQLRERWAAAMRVANEVLPPIVTAVAFGRTEDAADAPESSVPLRTLVAAWSLPLEWLVLVTAEDRENGVYLVSMARARARAARAVGTLREWLGDGGLAREVEGVTGWLNRFDARSWLELDDGPVSRLAGDGDGDAVEDVRFGLESLAAGDATSVAAAYRRLRRRAERLVILSRSS
ncbi:MAG: hypothetical protein GXX79_18320 [Actinomycetales bacterium]|nr:hypothetical protein [Actinomycetales bacterium]